MSSDPIGSAVYFSSGQYPGTISTNTLNQSNISGNEVGATYTGAETIDATNNWWGAADGPSGDGPGNGDSVDGTSGGGSIDFDPFLSAEAENTPCSPQPTCQELYPCGNNGDKVEVCHIPSDDSQEAYNICISPNALDVHLRHGDYCGPCED